MRGEGKIRRSRPLDSIAVCHVRHAIHLADAYGKKILMLNFCVDTKDCHG
jgi:hypothetical protein